MKIADGFLLDSIAGQYVAISLDFSEDRFSGMIKLSNVGAYLWQLLLEDKSEADLIKAVVEKYDIDEERAAKDIRTFLEQLDKKGILEK